MRIFLGSPIEEASELRFLRALDDLLPRDQDAVVLANLALLGRQIDFVIATNTSAAVIEIKSTRLPVRGSLNGPWQRLDAFGTWQEYPNAYRQSLGAKHAVRNSMEHLFGKTQYYPDCYVLFIDPLPEGSEVTSGDFKSRVLDDLSQFIEMRLRGAPSPWDLDAWVRFAETQSLVETSFEIAIESDPSSASAMLKRYCKAQAAELFRAGLPWLPEKTEDPEKLLKLALSSPGIQITGPSGCGKSLAACWLGATLSSHDHPVLFLHAKHYAGSWGDLIRKEIALTVEDATPSVLRAIRECDAPTFIVLDGLNELSGDISHALRGIRALLRRTGSQLIITTQTPHDGLEASVRYPVEPPSLELKQRIATSSATHQLPRESILAPLLVAARSGLEANIVGALGSELGPSSTGVTLVEQFLRSRLGAHARSGLRGLRLLAACMLDGWRYSLSETDFDEFMSSVGVEYESCDAMIRASVLVRRSGRISFFHEIARNACAAIEYARRIDGDHLEFGKSLASPRLKELGPLIISAIEDRSVCAGVLKGVSDPGLLAAAAEGELGAIAKSASLELLEDAETFCRSEIRSLEFQIDNLNRAVEVGNRTEVPLPMVARLEAIGLLASIGANQEPYFRLCREMDSRIESERLRLYHEAKESKIALRSGLFSLAYYGFGPAFSFSRVSQASRPGFSRRRKIAPPDLASLTSGQLLFTLEHRRSQGLGNSAAWVLELLESRLRREPYHVQLAILDAAHTIPRDSDLVGKIVEALDAFLESSRNWALNATAADALKALGAFDEAGEESRRSIKAEIDEVVLGQECDTIFDAAFALCEKSFDHPFDAIYFDELQDLATSDRNRIYRLALQSREVDRSFSQSWLLGEVVKAGDIADEAIIRRLSRLPDPQSSHPQDAWGVFVLSTRFLARFSLGLESVESEHPSANCLHSVQVLLYCADAGQADSELAARALRDLRGFSTQMAIGCLGEVVWALRDRHWSGTNALPPLDFVAPYWKTFLELSRSFISEGIVAEHFRAHAWEDFGATFAFAMIGEFGDRGDLELVRSIQPLHPFSKHVAESIKKLDLKG